MFRSDARHVTPAGPTELPPYYAERLQVVEPAMMRSPGNPEAQAERLFRDFKLGLLTLVVVSLLLLAYFWDGGHERQDVSARANEDVLSFSLVGRPRGEVLPLTASSQPRPVPQPQAREEAAPVAQRDNGYIYTVKPGDTLSAIAHRFYGDAAGWTAILEANRARLKRPSDLRAGMKIVVPLKGETASVPRRPEAALARAGPFRRE